MVNVEEFSKRLIIIMDYYDISAALLAEKIEVQRSSISHILSGRNKPSLEFVLKILKTFPEVELYWLLNGAGSFPKQNSTIEPSTPTLAFTDKKVKVDDEKEISASNAKKTATIEQIVIFYTDGTFKTYIP
ncbi:helix-turn-helix transcriptional regulator [Lutibacter sp.]